jgi:hypothetical protein
MHALVARSMSRAGIAVPGRSHDGVPERGTVPRDNGLIDPGPAVASNDGREPRPKEPLMRVAVRFVTASVVAVATLLVWQGTASAATAIEYGLIAALIS